MTSESTSPAQAPRSFRVTATSPGLTLVASAAPDARRPSQTEMPRARATGRGSGSLSARTSSLGHDMIMDHQYQYDSDVLGSRRLQFDLAEFRILRRRAQAATGSRRPGPSEPLVAAASLGGLGGPLPVGQAQSFKSR